MINADTNETLYQKKSTDKIAPASTAKMITALTVLDYCSTDDEMRVGAEIELMHDDSSRAWLMQGDTLTVHCGERLDSRVLLDKLREKGCSAAEIGEAPEYF